MRLVGEKDTGLILSLHETSSAEVGCLEAGDRRNRVIPFTTGTWGWENSENGQARCTINVFGYAFKQSRNIITQKQGIHIISSLFS